MEIFNELGNFRIADYKPSFTGILEKNHDTFYLKCISENQQDETNLREIINNFNSQNRKIKIPLLILGNISNTIPISLIAIPKSNKFRILKIFKGVHFKNFDEIKFKEINLSFNNIDSFIKTNNIEKNGLEMYEDVPLFDYLKNEDIKNREDLDKEKISYQFNLEYKSPSFEEIELDRFKLEIAPSFRIKPSKNSRKFCIIEEFKIWLKYYQKEDFIKIQDDINHLKSFSL